MRILVTGSKGFIGANFRRKLMESEKYEILELNEEATPYEWEEKVGMADFVVHLAGVNRPTNSRAFTEGNADLTRLLCNSLAKTKRPIPVIFSSSIQAGLDNPYGKSKLAAETILREYSAKQVAKVYLFRLPNVFGKWARPNYNSVVATFCHNVARGIPIQVNDPSTIINLIYVDDVVGCFMDLIAQPETPGGFLDVNPVYQTTVGELAEMIQAFPESRRTLVIPRVGSGLVRALHATYLSYLPAPDFVYGVRPHVDPRGEFVEMLKTHDSGQFSYFTAHPGVTRGNHYHHSKTEKFMVIRGTALFGFQQITTGDSLELVVQGGEGKVVETVPGWTHNIKNIGDDELIVMLWANEAYDADRPDTYSLEVQP